MRRAVCAIAMLAAACGPPSPGPIVQRLVDEYAPGLPIGERLPDEARARHRLEYDAYIGYHDYEYEAPDGLRGVWIQVHPGPRDTKRGLPPPDAKISEVGLVALNPASVARVDARVRAALGTPQILCYLDGYYKRVETRYWSGEHGRGILIRIWTTVPGSNAGSPWNLAEPGWADVIFSAEPMTAHPMEFIACR